VASVFPEWGTPSSCWTRGKLVLERTSWGGIAGPRSMCSFGLERREIRYRGDVQGVGFRFTAMRVARAYEVTGFVRNERDGSVWLVVEGRPAEIDGFLQDLADVMCDNIREVVSQTGSVTGEFAGFVIRH
jgi:acylphosphatase